MRKLLFLLAFLLLYAPLCRAQPVLTTIQDTLYNVDGSLMDGNIIVTNAAFSMGGVPIARGARAFPITNGVVSFELAPTDHSSPAIVYTVNTVSNGQTSTSVWSVPTLPSSRCPSGTCTIVQVTTLYTPGPTTTVALSQLSTQGASNGQLICYSSGVAVWCNPAATGVTSFNGRSGAVSPAANDYSFNQLAGTASVGQLPTGIPAANIGVGSVGNTAFGYVSNLTSDAQAQLNAKLAAANNLSDVGSPATALSNLGALPKGAVVTWIDQYCSVPGTYDDTCFSGAFTAAGSAQNVTFMMGPNTYTLQNGLSISSKIGWAIMGLKARSKLTVKNGLNTAMLTLNSTTDFAMRDVFADGNYTNQTSETSVMSATNIIGLIVQGNRFANVKGRAVVVSNSSPDSSDGLFIADNVISGTTDSALYGQQQSLIASAMSGSAVVRKPSLVLLGTTSLYGIGASQYNRIRIPAEHVGGQVGAKIEYKELGSSVGYGSFHFSNETVAVIDTLLARTKDGRRVNSIFGEGVNPLMRKIREGLDHIGLPSDQLLLHGNRRIIYGVRLAENFREVLLGVQRRPKFVLSQDQPKRGTALIAAFWQRRWLDGRILRPGIRLNLRWNA